MYGRMKEWINKRVNERNKQTKKKEKTEPMSEWINKGVNKWMKGRKRWENERIHESKGKWKEWTEEWRNVKNGLTNKGKKGREEGVIQEKKKNARMNGRNEQLREWINE